MPAACAADERTGDLRGDIQQFAELQRLFCSALTQRLAVNEFSRDEIHALGRLLQSIS